jgi:hypothetical protein
VNQTSGTSPADAPTNAPAKAPAAHGQQVEADVSAASGAPRTEAPAADATAGAQATAAEAEAAASDEANEASAEETAGAEAPGFRSRGSARRRARFLRKARELAYRDLGGLVFNLHRFGQRNDALVLAKLTTLTHIDAELRAIETWLRERQPITVLREAGITACLRCAAIHSSEDSFCPSCGLPVSRHVDLPAGFQAAAPALPAPAAPPPAPAAGAATPAATAPLGAPAPSAATPLSAPAPPAPAASAPAPSPPPPEPATAVTPPPTARAPHPPGRPDEGDGPTEILRPPVSGA